MFNIETEEDLHMLKTNNAGVQKAKYVIQEMGLTESVREMVEYYRKKKMDRKSEDAYVYDQGIEQGIERGIEAFIYDKLEDGIPAEQIVEKLQKHFQLEKKKAEEYVQRCLQKY